MDHLSDFGGLSRLVGVAQQADQATRQQIEQLVTTYRENWNNHNAAGIAALYTNDGVLVSQAPKVVKTGPQEIVQQYETAFKTVSHNDGATVEVFSLGPDALYSVGEYHLSGQNQSGGPLSKSTGTGLRSMCVKVEHGKSSS